MDKSTLNILILEDSEDDVLLITRHMKREGLDFEYDLVEDQASFEKALDKGNVDLVISDFALPDFNGLEALKLLRKRGFDYPFIMVSGTIGEDVAVQTMRAGAQDYIMKDKLIRLVPAIRRELQESEMRKEHRNAQRIIREKELFLSTVVDAIPNPIFYKDLEGKYIGCNYAFELLFGIRKEQLIKMTVYELLDEQNAKYSQDEDRLVIRLGKPRVYETKLINAEGVERDFKVYKSLISKESGSANGIVGVLVDMSDILQTQQALEESELRFRSMYENTSIGIFRMGLDGQFIMANPAFNKMIGCSTEGDLEHFRIKREYDVAQKSAFEEELLKEGMVFGFESRWSRIDGSPLWVRETARIITDEKSGKLIIEGTAEDLSDRKRAEIDLVKEKEKAEESDRLKTAFLANMSHEIRTPMNAIIGFSAMLSDEDLNNENRLEYVKHITENSNNLLSLINDIIDIAKVESDQLTVKISQCNVYNTLNDIQIAFLEIKKTLRKNDIEIELLLPEEPSELTINTDPFRFRQVINNLVSNALKYTKKGKVVLGCRVTESIIEIYVKDTGIGIPKDKFEVIFQRFRQVDESITREYGGTGLGLTISRKIASLLGGNISVDSKVGEGSVFYFRLPVSQIQLIQTPVKTHIEATNKYDWGDYTIMVVEDVESNYLYLCSAFRNTGVNIIWAHHGEEALEMFNKTDIDLILMDIQMPGMNGYEATRHIKNIDSKVPIIAATAFAMELDEQKSYDAGCDDYIAKPIRRSELLQKVNHWLSGALTNAE